MLTHKEVSDETARTAPVPTLDAMTARRTTVTSTFDTIPDSLF